MSRSTLGGCINWSACGVAQLAPFYGVKIAYIVVAMFCLGAGLMISATFKELKRPRK